MNAVVLEEDYESKIESLVREAYYSGARAVLKGKKGGKAALVPQEDLDFLEKVEGFLSGACYSGERIVLQGKEGNKVAMVSIEDLNLLEEFERKDVYEEG